MTILEFIESLLERPWTDYAYTFCFIVSLLACIILITLFACEIWPDSWRDDYNKRDYKPPQ